jgi:serine/threonine protein kinase
MEELDDRQETVVALPPEFEVLGTLGQNSKSIIYEAELRMLKKTVAVKVFTQLSADNDVLARMKREAMNLAKVDHPNIVKLLQVGFLSDKSPFLVYEYLKGITLEKSLKAGRMSLTDIQKIFSQILDGLDCAHTNGLVHRGLRPANIMLLMKGTTGKHHLVKILDFALSKEEGAVSNQSSGKTTITPFAELTANPKYLSPEQCCGAPVDARTDLYAVACMLYECIEGRPPYDGSSSAEIIRQHLQAELTPAAASDVAGFRKSINTLFARALAKSPEQRFQSASEFKDNLENAFRSVSSKDESTKEDNSKKIIISIGVALISIAIAGISIRAYVDKKSTEYHYQPIKKKGSEKKTQGLKRYGIFPKSQLGGLAGKINYLCNNHNLTLQTTKELEAELNSLLGELKERRERFIIYRLQYRLFSTLSDQPENCLESLLKALDQCKLPDGRETIEAAQAHFDAAIVYMSTGRNEEAKGELIRAKKLHDKYKQDPGMAPNLDLTDNYINLSNNGDLDWCIPLYLGRCLLLLDVHSKEGLQYLKQSADIAQTPLDRDAVMSLAELSMKLGDKKAAFSRLREYLKKVEQYTPHPAKGSLDTVNLLAYGAVGTTYLAFGERAEAQAVFRKGIDYSKRIQMKAPLMMNEFRNKALSAGLDETELEALKQRIKRADEEDATSILRESSRPDPLAKNDTNRSF